ncbi:helix-turn-helix domain-containing protein [Vagococcus lutrae]|uniref:helix-turn-helix domain-containing protein n=1 Tax=Vagococcus lutrae TaxID=81947 RepID=UPI00200CC655|nr:helix-turn-helix domain-containing protein [Vagococcus lutrae]UQF71495.1 helix-turn-helix domain-containing protein [Vagococcus lutrae]
MIFYKKNEFILLSLFNDLLYSELLLKDQLSEKYGISHTQLNNYISQLNNIFYEKENINLIILSNKTLHVKHHEKLNQLRFYIYAHYLSYSYDYQLLKNLCLTPQIKLDTLLSHLQMSESYFFKRLKEINQALAPYQLKIKLHNNSVYIHGPILNVIYFKITFLKLHAELFQETLPNIENEVDFQLHTSLINPVHYDIVVYTLKHHIEFLNEKDILSDFLLLFLNDLLSAFPVLTITNSQNNNLINFIGHVSLLSYDYYEQHWDKIKKIISQYPIIHSMSHYFTHHTVWTNLSIKHKASNLELSKNIWLINLLVFQSDINLFFNHHMFLTSFGDCTENNIQHTSESQLYTYYQDQVLKSFKKEIPLTICFNLTQNHLIQYQLLNILQDIYEADFLIFLPFEKASYADIVISDIPKQIDDSYVLYIPEVTLSNLTLLLNTINKKYVQKILNQNYTKYDHSNSSQSD